MSVRQADHRRHPFAHQNSRDDRSGSPDAAGTAIALAYLPEASDPSATAATRAGDPAARTCGRNAHPGLPVVVLAVAYGISRVAAAVAGDRYGDSALRGTPQTDIWQPLDVRLLRDHLATSVWHLNMQPPLFNLYAGLLLKLPSEYAARPR